MQFREANAEVSELLSLAYKRVGDKDTTSEVQQLLLLVLSPKRFVFCASQIAAEVAALEEGKRADGTWDAATAADDFPLQQWVQRQDLCWSGEELTSATLESRRFLLTELLTELLRARLAKQQTLSANLAVTRAPQGQQQLQQQLQWTLSRICESLSVSLSSDAKPQRTAEALHQAAAAIKTQRLAPFEAGGEPLLLRDWPAAAAATAKAEMLQRMRDLCAALEADYSLRRRVLIIRGNVALQAFVVALKSTEHVEAASKVLEKMLELERTELSPICVHSVFAARSSVLAAACATTSRVKIGGAEGPRSWVRAQQLVGSAPPCAGGKPQHIDDKALRQSIARANAALKGKPSGGFSSASQGGGHAGRWGAQRGRTGGAPRFSSSQRSVGPSDPQGGGLGGGRPQASPNQRASRAAVAAAAAPQTSGEQQQSGAKHRNRRGSGRNVWVPTTEEGGHARGGGFGGRASDLPPSWTPPKSGL
ncbi:hypothetical protein Esti_006208 [Eimeria stiedai]